MFLAGCRVDARVDISVRADGSGTVRATIVFDEAAVQRVGGVRALRLDDLRAAGWTVSTGPRSVTVAHDFVGQAELAERLADLAGRDGVFRDARLVRDRGLFSSRNGLSVDVDLRRLASGVRDDSQLRAALQQAGVDVTALSTRLDRELRDAFRLTVALHLPDGTTRSLRISPGTQHALRVTHATTATARLLLVIFGVAFALISATALLIVAKRADTRLRNRTQT